MNHLTSVWQPDLVIVKKKKKKRICWIVDFAIPSNHRVKLKESEKTDKYLDLARETEKTIKYESDSDTECNWCTWYSNQKFDTGTWGLGNERTSGDHRNKSVVKDRPEYWEES